MSAGFFTPTKTLDAKLDLLKQAPRGLKTGSRIRFYNTTQEAIGRITLLGPEHTRPGRGGFCAAPVRTTRDRPARRPVHPAFLFSHGDLGRRHGPEPPSHGGTSRRPCRSRSRTSASSNKGCSKRQLALLISGKGLAGMEEAEVIGAMAADKQRDRIGAGNPCAEEDRAPRRQPLRPCRPSRHAGEEDRSTSSGSTTRTTRSSPGLDKEELKGMLRMRICRQSPEHGHRRTRKEETDRGGRHRS